MRIALLATSALVSVGLAAPAMAQDANDDGISEIVVTAQKKEESLQKAGIAIDAVTGGDLAQAGILKADDLNKAVPAITISNGGGSATSIFLRGIGNFTNSSYNDPAVTPSYDGVVMGRAAGAFSAAFFDLQRVEVLKGPQGILYGRNATGGAVNVIPVRPQLGQDSGGVSFTFGNYNTIGLDAYANVATSENSALRLGVTRQSHDGYNRDGTDDLDRTGLRAQFLIKPSDTVSIRLAADYTKIKGRGAGGSYIGAFLPGPTGFTFISASGLDSSEGLGTVAANAFRTSQIGAPGFGFLQGMNTEPVADYTYWGVHAEVTVETGIGTLTVLPAYRVSDGSSYFNGPAFNTAYTDENDKQFSLETRLAGKAGMLDYVVGGFYFNEKINATGQYNQEFVLPIQHYEHKTESWAAFGQLTAHVGDKFRLIGGARYTHDNKSIDGIINNFITFCGGIPPVTPPASFGVGCAAPGGLPRYPNFTSTTQTINWLVANGWIPAGSTDQANLQVFPVLTGAGLILKTYNPVVDSGTYSRTTWKVSAEYDVAPDSMVYATVETGYRAGGFQLAEGRPSYKPEYITAYSLGSKNRFLDNKVQLNIEAFWWKYRDQQITYFTVDTSGTLINSNENAGKLTVKGFDIDLIVKPTHGTTLSAKVQYLDSKYDNLHLITAPPRNNIACPFTLTGAMSGGAPVMDFNCSGMPGLFSPKWTINLGAEQVVPVTGSLELVGAVNTSWRAKQWGGFEYLAFEQIPSYWLTDLNLTLRDADNGWSIGGFVHNLEGDRRIARPQASPIGFATANYTAPRTYGIRISADF
ncbi:TonB-dependent receptor [Novosphingobium sp.]|uniref:TonB-dependent receptor n=1 Tax=Novosphingobium sp. TaxID=1874826 RepID=UPI0035B23408